MEKTYPINLTQGEMRALFDAASQMSNDFEDYYSFMGPKKVLKHRENYDSAMDKLKSKFRKRR